MLQSQMRQTTPQELPITDIESNIINKFEADIEVKIKDLHTEIRFLGSFCIIIVGLISVLYVKMFN